MNEELARKQRERGYSDGKVGHSPSLLCGPYMEGYIQGRSGDELNHDFRIPPDPKDVRIEELDSALNSLHMKYAGACKRIEKLEVDNEMLRDLLRRIYKVPNLNLGDDDLVCELDEVVYRDS